jgi:hypothetical protein
MKENLNPLEEIKNQRSAKRLEQEQRQEAAERGKEKIPELSKKISDLFIREKDCFEVYGGWPDDYSRRGIIATPEAELKIELPLEGEDPVEVKIALGISYYREKLEDDATEEEVFRSGIRAAIKRPLPNKDQMAEQIAEEGFLSCSFTIGDFDHYLTFNKNTAKLISKASITRQSYPMIIGPGGGSYSTPKWERYATDEDMERYSQMVDAIMTTPGTKFEGSITRV